MENISQELDEAERGDYAPAGYMDLLEQARKRRGQELKGVDPKSSKIEREVIKSGREEDKPEGESPEKKRNVVGIPPNSVHGFGHLTAAEYDAGQDLKGRPDHPLEFVPRQPSPLQFQNLRGTGGRSENGMSQKRKANVSQLEAGTGRDGNVPAPPVPVSIMPQPPDSTIEHKLDVWWAALEHEGEVQSRRDHVVLSHRYSHAEELEAEAELDAAKADTARKRESYLAAKARAEVGKHPAIRPEEVPLPEEKDEDATIGLPNPSEEDKARFSAYAASLGDIKMVDASPQKGERKEREEKEEKPRRREKDTDVRMRIMPEVKTPSGALGSNTGRPLKTGKAAKRVLEEVTSPEIVGVQSTMNAMEAKRLNPAKTVLMQTRRLTGTTAYSGPGVTMIGAGGAKFPNIVAVNKSRFLRRDFQRGDIDVSNLRASGFRKKRKITTSLGTFVAI